MMKGLEHHYYKDRLRNLRPLSLEKGRRNLINVCKYQNGTCKENNQVQFNDSQRHDKRQWAQRETKNSLSEYQ